MTVILALLFLLLGYTPHAFCMSEDGEASLGRAPGKLILREFAESPPLIQLPPRRKATETSYIFKKYTAITNVKRLLEAQFLARAKADIEAVRRKATPDDPFRSLYEEGRERLFPSFKGFIVFDLDSTLIFEEFDGLPPYAIYEDIGHTLEQLRKIGYIVLACTARNHAVKLTHDGRSILNDERTLRVLRKLGIEFSTGHDIELNPGALMRSGIIFAPPTDEVRKGPVLQEYFHKLFFLKPKLKLNKRIWFFDDLTENLFSVRKSIDYMFREVSLYLCETHILSTKGFTLGDLTNGFFENDIRGWKIQSINKLYSDATSLEKAALFPVKAQDYVLYFMHRKFLFATK